MAQETSDRTRHNLSEVDEENRSAFCSAHNARVRINKSGTYSSGKIKWRCALKAEAWREEAGQDELNRYQRDWRKSKTRNKRIALQIISDRVAEITTSDVRRVLPDLNEKNFAQIMAFIGQHAENLERRAAGEPVRWT